MSTKEEKQEWSKEFKDLDINSEKLKKRFITTMKTLSNKPQSTITGASRNKAEAKAIYRMLSNEKLTEKAILISHRGETLKKIKKVENKIILAIQDTTGINYTTHKKTEGLGNFCTTEGCLGFNVHSCMAVTTEGVSLGILDQIIWTREKKVQKKTDKRKISIKEKESGRWLTSMERSNEGIPKDIKVINICDREGDIYELFEKAVIEEKIFLIRVIQNRKTTDKERILDKIKKEKAAGRVTVNIPRDTRNKIPEREVNLEIRYKEYEVKSPERKETKTEEIKITIIQAKEETDEKAGIEWILATNEKLETVEEAYERIKYYVQRWKIERLHYILKSGCKIEELQERTARKLKILILMYTIISLKILRVTYLSRIEPDISCKEVFKEDEWKILYCMANETRKVPKKPPTIKEAMQYVAKLGGFLGRKSDKDPRSKSNMARFK